MRARILTLALLLGSGLPAGAAEAQAPTPGDASPARATSSSATGPSRPDCTLAPRWHRVPTRFGISLGSNDGGSMKDDLDREEKRFGARVPVVRTWDDTMPTRSSWPVKKKWYGQRWVVTSIRVTPQEVLSGGYDAKLRHYFRSAPRRYPIFWNYWHEPEDEIRSGQFSAQQYRRAWRHVARIAGALCRTNLYPTLVLMGWTANAAATPSWQEVDPGRRFVSVYGWDPYNGALGDARTYVSPRLLFRPVVAVSKRVRRPFAIAETGTVRIPGDGSGAGRAAWLRDVIAYTVNHHAVFVTYYQSTRNGDFELRRSSEIGVWREAMQ